MDLKAFLAFGRKKEPEKKFLALRVGSQSLTGVVWMVVAGKVELGKLECQELPSVKEEDFLSVADKVVSSVTAEIVPEPKEVLFGLPSDWVFDGKIADQYLATLRKISKDLGLVPLGFVVLPEAIANYYKELESTPLTAILVGIEVSKLFVTLARAGKIIKTEVVEVVDSSNLNTLIEEALKKFVDVEVLPSRILIYDGGEDLEVLKNQILSYPWTQKLQFLHYPKVETVVDTEVARAVAVAGGTEMGGAIEPVNSEQSAVNSSVENVVPVVDTGFVVEKDIAGEIQNSKFKIQNFKLPDLKIKLPNLPNFSKKIPLFIGALIIGLLIIGFAGYFALTNMVLKNQLVITVDPKILEGQRDIMVVTSGEISDADPKILASKIEVEESGTKRGVVTGKKLVGEKAKGAIAIYGTTMGRTFAAGTAVTNGNLKFLMDSGVTVASGSAASPASATVNVTAAGIGESFNLGAGTLFEVGDYPQSSFQGKNEAAFTGGSSRQVMVVTKTDQERLAATLSAELTAKGLENLKTQLGTGQNFLDKAVTTAVISKKFDKEVEAEAESVGLTMAVKLTGVTVDEKQLMAKMGNLLAPEIPPDFDFDISRATLEIVGSKTDKEGSIILTTKLAAKLMPKIDRTKIVADLAGKGIGVAGTYLQTLPQYISHNILTTPAFLSGLRLFSPNPKNITVEIITK
jgi:hypothetical protein